MRRLWPHYWLLRHGGRGAKILTIQCNNRYLLFYSLLMALLNIVGSRHAVWAEISRRASNCDVTRCQHTCRSYESDRTPPSGDVYNLSGTWIRWYCSTVCWANDPPDFAECFRSFTSVEKSKIDCFVRITKTETISGSPGDQRKHHRISSESQRAA